MMIGFRAHLSCRRRSAAFHGFQKEYQDRKRISSRRDIVYPDNAIMNTGVAPHKLSTGSKLISLSVVSELLAHS